MTRSRKEWLAERRTGIGGSDVAAIMGVSPWRTPLQVYEEKVGLADEQEESEAMRWGRVLEPVVVAEFARRQGVEVVPGGDQVVRHRDMPWMLATVDGLVGTDQGLEAKTARSAQGWGDVDGDDVPMPYMLQVQHYMIVTGRPVWWVAVLIGGSDFRVRRVDLNAELAGMIIKECANFWHYNVEKRVPPAATTAEEARRKFPTPASGSMAQASQDIVEATRRLAALKAEAKAIEGWVEVEQARIMDAMGTAEALRHGDQVLATWKASDTTRLDTKALAAAHPALVAQFTKTSTGRRFLLKTEKGG